MERLLDECCLMSNTPAHFTWVSEQFLSEAGILPWSREMPLRVPASHATIFTANCGKALAVGLTYHGLVDAIRDALQWVATQPIDLERRAGLSPDRERQLRQAWHSQSHVDG
jgi:2'-hydroxyisoflavone reductase